MKLNLDPDPNGQPGGGNSTDWKASLPEDLRSATVLANVPDVATLVKNYVNAESLIGKKRVPQPDPKWNDQQWDEFYAQVGRPATPDKYGVPDFKFEEGLTVQPELVDKAKMHFHKLGLNERQAKGILEYYFGMENDRFKTTRDSTATERLTAEEAMKKKWGDKFDVKVESAKAVLKKFDKDGAFTNYLNESKLGNDPRMVEMLAEFAATMREDSSGQPGGSGGLPLPDSQRAKLELEELKGDDEFKKKFMQGDKWAVNKWNELHRLAARS